MSNGGEYITKMNHFWRSAYEGSELSTGAVTLYFYLLEKFNKKGWPLSYKLANKELYGSINGMNEKTFIKCRKELCDVGLIGYCKGIRARAAGTYTIDEDEIKLWSEQMKQTESETDKKLEPNSCKIYSHSYSHSDENNCTKDCKIYSPIIRQKTKQDDKTINKGVENDFPHTQEYYQVHKFGDERAKQKFVDWVGSECGLTDKAKEVVELFCKDMDVAGWEWKWINPPTRSHKRQEVFLQWWESQGRNRGEWLNKEWLRMKAQKGNDIYYEKKDAGSLQAQASTYAKTVAKVFGLSYEKSRELVKEWINYMSDHENQWNWREYPIKGNRIEAIRQFIEYEKNISPVDS